MSFNIDTGFIKKYQKESLPYFEQDKSHLRDTVMPTTVMPGEQFEAQLIGEVDAIQQGRFADLEPADIDHTPIVGTTAEWKVPLYFAEHDMRKVVSDANYRSTYQKRAMASMNRKLDGMILNAFAANYTATAASGNAMDAATLIKLREELDDAEVPDEDRYLAITSSALTDILNDTKLPNRDYVRDEYFSTGRVQNLLMGFNVKKVTRKSLFPLGPNSKRLCFAYSKNAATLGMQVEPTVKINYVPQKDAWLILGVIDAGAIVSQASGVIGIEIDN